MANPLSAEAEKVVRALPFDPEYAMWTAVPFLAADRYALLPFVEISGSYFGPGQHAAVQRKPAGNILVATIESRLSAERKKIGEQLNALADGSSNGLVWAAHVRDIATDLNNSEGVEL